eukprot:GHRQ01037567.1.p2 GENE.GHRQ01037567.1~~GHRQ01037567.1.p2  ORF type:complete len:118 (-),score=10.39 GHRQ01037567.1:145-498(-)
MLSGTQGSVACKSCGCWTTTLLLTRSAAPPTAAKTHTLQIARDAAAEVPPPDPILEGGSSPEERQASFLELALCLAGGLPDAALDPLFAVSDRPRVYWLCRGSWVQAHGGMRCYDWF